MASTDSKSTPEEIKSEVQSEKTENKSDKPAENGAAKSETESSVAVKTENGSGEEVKKEGTADAAGGETKKPQRFRFTGAAKRRYRSLIQNGYDREEAAKLAMERNKVPGKNGPFKRGNSEGLGGPPNKSAKKIIRMAVATENFPATTFTGDQANKVKSAILKQMLREKDTTQKPHFQDCSFNNGYLLVHCADLATVKWLQHTVPKLVPYKGCSLKVTNERTLAKTEVLIGVFNDSRQDTSKDILGFIECQNDGLSTSKWTVISRKEVPKKQSVELTFSVDPASAKVLLKNKYELNYKFNKMTIRKKTTESSANKAGNRPRSSSTGGFYRNRSQQRSSSFVPIWDNNVPRGGANYARSRSPPRGFGNRNGNRYGGGRSNRYSGGGNNSTNRSVGGNAFTSGADNRTLPSLVDTLCTELLRSVSGSGMGQGGGNNYQQVGGRNFGGRSGFF